MSLSNSELLYWPVDDRTQAIDAKSRSYLRNALQVPAFRLLVKWDRDAQTTILVDNKPVDIALTSNEARGLIASGCIWLDCAKCSRSNPHRAQIPASRSSSR